MKLASRIALAAWLSGVVAVVLVTAVGSILFSRSVSGRIDEQLEERSRDAAVLAAVGDRIENSELSRIVDGTRIVTDTRVIEIGRLPEEDLPVLRKPGLRTVRADGESWRLYAVEILDVPAPGDVTLVEFVEPLGDITAQRRILRRRVYTIGGIVAAVMAGLALIAGRQVAGPLTRLAAQVRSLDAGPPESWAIRIDDSTPEVEDISTALNTTLNRLAEASRRREEALAAARSFASSASHELRTPLQSAMTNLDVAMLGEPTPQVIRARAELDRMGNALDAVRLLSEVDLVDDDMFSDADLGDLADQAVGLVAAEGSAAGVHIHGPEGHRHRVWADGVRLAIVNLIRNAVRHGRPVDGSPLRIDITVTADGSITVEDNGPGIPEADRERIRRPFERGASSTGSGLGLAFVQRVADVHGGTFEIGNAPDGGARVTLHLGGNEPTTLRAGPWGEGMGPGWSGRSGE
ncbi:MAG: HAMP domain-containing histidine kinase [Acidimicrobiia bacterium]|nr:HAMP domain-containing histidine kinase [Acidimicrobiia bacterium]